jgi:hypothetical protein
MVEIKQFSFEVRLTLVCSLPRLHHHEVRKCSNVAAATATGVEMAVVVTGNEIDAVVSSTVVAGIPLILQYPTSPNALKPCP